MKTERINSNYIIFYFVNESVFLVNTSDHIPDQLYFRLSGFPIPSYGFCLIASSSCLMRFKTIVLPLSFQYIRSAIAVDNRIISIHHLC